VLELRRRLLGVSVSKILAAAMILVVAFGTARADEAPAPKPWAAGVSESEQAIALALYEQGNAEFQAARFAQALAKYAEALKHWDHPAIHFNMTVCLINLDQPIEAKTHLDRALAYGADAIGGDMFAQGLTYQHSLDGQIARVRISCKEPGASITLDGTFLFTGPGELERMVLPGAHQVVASKAGYLTRSESLQLSSSKVTRYEVRLVAFKAETHYARRWATWKPYAVLGGGVALGALGGLAYLLATHEIDQYDAGVAAACPHGCDAAANAMLDDVNAHRSHGELARDIAVALFALGGTAVLAGTVGIVVNQPRAVSESAPTAQRGGRELLVTWGAAW
jgi:tetratricopeptide (TPR) repeat protein